MCLSQIAMIPSNLASFFFDWQKSVRICCQSPKGPVCHPPITPKTPNSRAIWVEPGQGRAEPEHTRHCNTHLEETRKSQMENTHIFSRCLDLFFFVCALFRSQQAQSGKIETKCVFNKNVYGLWLFSSGAQRLWG